MRRRTSADTSKEPLTKERSIQGRQKEGRAKNAASEMIKVKFHITREQVIALDRIGAKSLQAGANLSEVDKSTLMGEAINLLVKPERV